MPSFPLMQQFVEDELSRAPELAERTVAATMQQLQQPPKTGTASGPSDRKVQQDLVEALRRNSRSFEQAFVDRLRALVLDDMQGPKHHPSTSAQALAGDLQLVDETRIEADIEISRAAQLIDSTAEWELRELQTFTSSLIGQSHVSADSNPLRPIAYAHALWDACSAVIPAAALRSLLLPVAAGVMASQLKMAWAAACTRLESRGVIPSIYRTVVVSGVPAAAPPPSTPKAFEQALQQISTALHDRSARSQPIPVASAAMRTASTPTIPQGLDPHVVELLSRIFEAVLSDEQLLPSLRPVMARLQTAVLRLYLVDRTLLDNSQHPVWLLMNRIAHASQLWPLPNDPRTARLLASCESIVNQLVTAPQQTTLSFSEGLARIEAHLSHELNEQLADAGPTIAALTALEQRVQLEQGISRQLAQQVQRVSTTPRVREFVTHDWARVIVESTLRYGDGDERTASAVKTVDDLLWSLNIPDHPQSRQRLLSLLPDLLKRVRAGMSLISLPQTQQQMVLDELLLVHTASLPPGTRARLRDEGLSAPVDASAKTFVDSLIEIASMDTVPAALISEVNPSGSHAEQQLDAMAPGASCRWFINGRWCSAQLLWLSDSRNYFVFAGETLGRTHSITRQALARLINESLLKPLSDAQLTQRAVHRVMRDLAESR